MNKLSQKLWAKSEPHHFLWRHLLDAAAVARALEPRFGSIEGLPDGWTAFLVGCHDIGKADAWFQNKDDGLAAQLRSPDLPLPVWKVSEPDAYKKFRHEVRSQEWLQSWLQNPARGWGRKAASVAAKAIVGHHGDWNPQNFYSTSDEKPIWPTLRDDLGDWLWAMLRPEPAALATFPHASAAGAKLSAYVILSDWIASNDHLFPFPDLKRHEEPEAYFWAACDLARQVVAQLKLGAPSSNAEKQKPTLSQVWPPDKFPRMKTPRPLQSALEARRDELPPGLAIIEAPTGEGKTEAAIYLAQVWNSASACRGTFFALPTQATSNAMFKRYQEFLTHWKDDPNPRLLHGMAWLRDDLQPQDDELEFLPQLDAGRADEDEEGDKRAKDQARTARDWFRPSRRALLGDEGVGTVDQALLCALRVKFGTLRLLGLSQKTLIVDECHAYDEFMSAILERLLEWCRALDINVILLSATLAYDQRKQLARAYAGKDGDWSAIETHAPSTVPYPLLTFVPRSGAAFLVPSEADPTRARTLQIEALPGLLDDFAATARLAVATVQHGGCLCVLVNTVRGAQEIFRELQQLQSVGQLPADCVLDLFHARFRADKRADIEARVVASFGPPDVGQDQNPPRPRCSILVSTQVVEQSLDVDFDFFLSQIAPVDLLLQRAGRLWRHERGQRACDFPTLCVLTPPQGAWDFGASGKVYQSEILLRSLALVQPDSDGKREWNLPADFRALIETCYRRDADLGAFAQTPGFDEALTQGIAKRDEFRRDSHAQAGDHLWVEPSPKSFEPMAHTKDEPDEEGSGAAQKYFVARTRLGDESAAVLAIADAGLLQVARTDPENARLPRDQQRPPKRAVLKKLFGCKVGVPRWWLFDKTGAARPLEGFEPFFEGESFLRGHVVLPLRERNGEHIWCGQNAGGRFAIVDDPTLGLLRRNLEKAPETREEADAGEAI